MTLKKISFLITVFILISIQQGCSRKPKGKSIDHVSVPVLSRDEIRALKKYPNANHLEAVKKSPLKEPIENHEWFDNNKDKLLEKGSLIKVEDTENYIVSKLIHSVPYLTERSVEFLDLLGKRMEESLEDKELLPYRFVLTSILRTEADQKKLRKINYNATKNETAHFYGITFDISQTRFAMWDSRESLYTYRLRNILARELIKLQEEGYCCVLLENREKCFHITVLH